MKVLVEFRVGSGGEYIDQFYEERKESELPKPGERVIHRKDGIVGLYACGEQIGSSFYNMGKQIQYTFHCEEIDLYGG
jgi:hypothetical protein